MILLQNDNDKDRESIVIIMIEPDNLHRMEQADPITLESGKNGFLKSVKYPDNLRLIIAYESDPGRFYEMVQQNRFADLIRDLHRGYRFMPKDGKRAAGAGDGNES